jgi:hypothetical protein
VTSTTTAASPPGTYTISVSGAVDPNYAFTYVNGVMQVDPGQGPLPPPPLAPLADNVSNTIENNVADNIGGEDNGAILPTGTILTIGQSVSYLAVANGPPDAIETAAALASAAGDENSALDVAAIVPESDGNEHSQLGRRNLDRDVHSYANAYLASIGLAASK